MTTEQRLKAIEQQLASGPQLQAVEGTLEPVGRVLKTLTRKSVKGVEPLISFDDVVDHPPVNNKAGINAENLKRIWATLVHFRMEDDSADAENIAADLKDLKVWAKDSHFLRLVNIDPALAVVWFMDAALDEEDDED